MKIIYAVGVVKLKEKWSNRDNCSMAFLFSNFKNAEDAILNNTFDLFERYYDYAIIEKQYILDEGSDEKSDINRCLWYKPEWNDDGEVISVSQVETPENYKNLVNLLGGMY